ncbi:hypothetical protein Goshw_009006 [Gossypium schwendimanii]|uniref:Uncharacterized protein n=1 Tax=Gossypium schwendimanii TaxID=34291 RepID=A0A7J9KKB5_GOSSC|nr:hypothetical protein [Gossypium schwendimanii]
MSPGGANGPGSGDQERGDLRCIFEHASRKENGLVHLLAAEKLRRGENTYLIVGVLLFVVAEVEKDKQWQESSD